jgi:2-oxoisovalerate dehydrogenase E1 component alpha subunit
VERARSNRGATVIEMYTYRAGQHSTSDDPNRYRPADDGSNWPLGDPVARLADHLTRLGQWSPEQQAAAEKEALEQVRAAGREAEAIGTLGQSRPDVGHMFEDVYKDMDWRLIRQRQELGA